MAKQKQTSKVEIEEPLIVSSVKFDDGHKHLFQSILEDDPESFPELKAVGYASIKGVGWVSYTVTFKGPKVLRIEVEEPGDRIIAEEASKIAFVHNFVDKDVF